ncbi:hypothetical protein GIB67_023972 [Kingdonia uniflora]|uniref:Uncharacterized protein n=1 Tax=Kingdonia uniflora TaxID=39325 RepID=A0A7J7LPD2_9MAGN|nr:hypothetical protein GIB67_023972 [Kingdonia uniflora]
MEEKLKYGCDGKVAASEGYGSRMLVRDDSVLDWRDYFDHHTLPVSRRNPSKWPEFSTNYKGVVVEYSDQMNVLAMKLLGMISESLGLPTWSVEDVVLKDGVSDAIVVILADQVELELADPDFYKIGYVRSVRAYGADFKEGPDGFGVYATKDIEPLRRARVILCKRLHSYITRQNSVH